MDNLLKAVEKYIKAHADYDNHKCDRSWCLTYDIGCKESIVIDDALNDAYRDLDNAATIARKDCEVDNEPVYVTFGTGHKHFIDGEAIDVDSVVKVESRARAHELFGVSFCNTYMKEKIDCIMHYYPNGVVDLIGRG